MDQVSTGYADTAIESADLDRFGFPVYVGELANVVETAAASLTIGLYGRWGSGKTSLMKLLRNELEERAEGKPEKLETIWINVWQLSSQEQVWQAFLQALFGSVHSQLSLWQRIDKLKLAVELAKNALRLLIVLTPLILALIIDSINAEWDEIASQAIARGGILASVGLLILTATRLGPIVEAARQTATFDLQDVLKYAPYEAQITTLMKLEDQFESLVTTFVGPNGRLIVFVDDLDRCGPDNIAEILDAIKLFTTSEHCVYVLGLDHDIVLQGVKTKYNFGTKEATEYLEKIVQIPFHLPPLDRHRIADFIRRDYADIVRVCPAAPDVFSFGLEPNPRKVKRALNIYRTLHNLARTRIAAKEMDPVDPELLAKMVVIQSHFRDLYKALVRDLTLIVDLETWAESLRALEQDPAGKPDFASVDETWTEYFRPLAAPVKRVAKETRRRLDETSADREAPLVPASERPTLAAMLNAGSVRFGKLGAKDLGVYVFLTGTVTSERFVFEPSAALTFDLRRQLESILASFENYFAELGYRSASDERVHVNVQPKVHGEATFDMRSNTINLSEAVAGDPDVALREYAHHLLWSTVGDRSSSWILAYREIEYGLADYFPCSFANDPLVAEVYARQAFGAAYIRNLENDLKFTDFAGMAPPQRNPWKLGEIWGGAFWQVRKLLGQGEADQLIYGTWSALPLALNREPAIAFVEGLLEANESLRDGKQSDTLREIFRGRGLQI